MPVDPTAAPARDWNERISADCYRPNAELGNLGAMSWNLGPTLAGWLQAGDPIAYRGFVEGDRGANGMAQPFHHTIMPLASAADRLTEVRWGLRDFEVRFGRRPTGMWLPETAVDTATLRLLADHGITHTVLAPWQVVGLDGGEVDTRRPVRLDLGDGRSIVAVLYDGLLSAAVSFDPAATVDADAFVRDRLLPRLWQEPLPGDAPSLVVIATDGELYGHHQPLRGHFLARLVGRSAPPDLPYATPALGAAVDRATADGAPAATAPRSDLVELPPRHRALGLELRLRPRRHVEGPAPQRARPPRRRRRCGHRARGTRLAEQPGSLGGARRLRRRAARSGDACRVRGCLARRRQPPPAQRATFAAVMDAQRWRLAMFASCGWFWEAPARIETAGALRAAVRAARLVGRSGRHGPRTPARRGPGARVGRWDPAAGRRPRGRRRRRLQERTSSHSTLIVPTMPASR